MRHEFLSCGDETIKTEYRKIFSTVSDLMDEDEPSAMSAYAYSLAKQTDWNWVRGTRQQNAETLTSILSDRYIKLIQDFRQAATSMYRLRFQTEMRCKRRLSTEGIFNTIIWPLMDEQKKPVK